MLVIWHHAGQTVSFDRSSANWAEHRMWKVDMGVSVLAADVLYRLVVTDSDVNTFSKTKTTCHKTIPQSSNVTHAKWIIAKNRQKLQIQHLQAHDILFNNSVCQTKSVNFMCCTDYEKSLLHVRIISCELGFSGFSALTCKQDHCARPRPRAKDTVNPRMEAPGVYSYKRVGPPASIRGLASISTSTSQRFLPVSSDNNAMFK